NPDPGPSEYSVPLVAITSDAAAHASVDPAAMRDRASHLNILPAILVTFGYDGEWVRSVYGPTLAGPPAPYITYVSLGWQARGTRNGVDSTRFVQTAHFPRRP